MKLYSPSSREDFSFCPRYWWLRKRYTTKRVGYPELCAMGGIAVGEAQATWNKSKITGETVDVDSLVSRGLQSLTEQLACVSYHNRQIEGTKDREFADELYKLVEMGVRALWDANLFAQHSIVAVEHEFTDWGKARPDLISRDPMGRLVVDDYKVKFGEFLIKGEVDTWKEPWLKKEFDKHFSGEQRIQYTTLANADLFAIVLVILKPMKDRKMGKPVVYRGISPVIKDHERNRWKQDALLHYQHMEVVEQQQDPVKVPGKAFPHANQYGDCKFLKACLEYELKPELIQLDYMEVKNET